MSRWDALLAVQEHDTAVDQLTHRRAHLPSRAELASVMAERSRIEAAIAELDGRRGELLGGQQRLEGEISSLGEKATNHDKVLYGGTVGNPRELQALQDEIAALRRRIGQLEDQEIELMEELEPLDAERAAALAAQADLDARADALHAQIAGEEESIDADLARLHAERTDAAGTVEPDLLAEYERVRPHAGGIAIARLVGGSCGGCHLGLSAVEIDRIKKLPPEAPAYCEECGRLLAR